MNIFIYGILPIALFMVGFTQLLKQFFEPKSKKVKILITIAVGIIGGVVRHYVPEWVFVTLLGVSFGVVFYDYFLKYIEKTLEALTLNNKYQDKQIHKTRDIEGLR